MFPSECGIDKCVQAAAVGITVTVGGHDRREHLYMKPIKQELMVGRGHAEELRLNNFEAQYTSVRGE